MGKGFPSWQERWHRWWKKKGVKPEDHISTQNRWGHLSKMRPPLDRTDMVHGWSQPIWLLVPLADFHESHEKSVTRQRTKPIRRPDFPCELKEIPFLLNLILIFYDRSSLETSLIIIFKSVDLVRINWQYFNTTTLRLVRWISWLRARLFASLKGNQI